MTAFEGSIYVRVFEQLRLRLSKNGWYCGWPCLGFAILSFFGTTDFRGWIIIGFAENIKKPRRLALGSTLGIVTPAGPPDRQMLAEGRKILESMGLQTVLDAETGVGAGWPADSDGGRAAQLMGMLTDPAVDAVICSRGGYGSMRVIPLLDWRAIGRLDKALVGFSDVCALLQTMVTQAGVGTFHGPMVCSLAQTDSESLASLKEMLTSAGPVCLPADRPVILRAGRAEGILAGGNLTTLCHLIGTPYSVHYEKCILFLEDIGEAPYRIDRMLWQMRQAGCFDGLAGLALGSFDGCGDERRVFDIVVECFADLQIPILAGFGMGHGSRNWTWPLGAACRIDTGNGCIDLIECATVECATALE